MKHGDISYFLGHQGEIRRQMTQDELGEWLKKSHATMAEFPLQDLCDLLTDSIVHSCRRDATVQERETCDRAEQKELSEFVANFYQKLGKYAQYGEIIRVQRLQIHVSDMNIRFIYVINFVGRLTFQKPVLAADIMPYFKDIDNKFFEVLIRRKNDPGAGEIALVGGRRDVIGPCYETGMQAALREGEEEIGLEAVAHDSDLHRMRNEPMCSKIRVRVRLPGGSLDGVMLLVGMCQTSEQEIYEPLDERRIHETTAYALIVNCFRPLTCEKILEWFEARSDAKEVIVRQVNFNDDQPPLNFGIAHHAKLREKALSMLNFF